METPCAAVPHVRSEVALGLPVPAMTTTAPLQAAIDVILRDGGTIRLRPPTADDLDGILEFFSHLSDRSLFLRFHGFRTLDRSAVEPYLDPDWSSRGAFVATLGEDATNRIVALGNYARTGEPEIAEMAFAVSDDEQGRGIGTRLLEQLALAGRRHGISRFIADVLASNTTALAVFRDAGFEVARTRDGDEMELRFPITATADYEGRVAQRDHVAVVNSLRPFFRPSSVAVVGASRRRGSIGGELFRNILAADFAGAVYPINLKAEPVAGVRAYSSIGEIDSKIDLAVICLPGEQVVDAARAALDHGVTALCVISAGFAETGAEGRDRQESLLALVRAHGARLVGPNCLGIAVPALGLNATFASQALPAGTIGFSSQSGALGLALLEKAAERKLGFSAFASIGNKADVSSNDLLEWWEDDEDTNLVLLYLESFGNPRSFSRIARRVARRKPILALKAGSTSAGSRAAGSHTAALAGSETAADALFHQTGVLRARTLEELVDAAALLSREALPAGRRVGVITNAGGLGILCADACEAAGLELPTLTDFTRDLLLERLPVEASLGNPIDVLGSATAETYRAALEPLLADPNIDSIVALFVPPVVAGANDVAAAIRETVERSGTSKPVIAAIVSAEGVPAALRDPDSKVIALPYPESAARALAFAADYADWLRRPAGSVVEPEGIDRAGAHAIIEEALGRADGDGWLAPESARTLLDAYGVPVVRERLALTPDEAVSAARDLGLPVVVKLAAPGLHKTDVGGVALDLRDEQQVREAVERLGAAVIVQPYLTGRTELLAGVVQDPLFGPLVAFGPGGALAELIGDAGFRLAPLTDLDADELVTRGKAGRLVRGFRGAPPADADALRDLVIRLGRLADDFPEVSELDLNPILAGPEGCVAVDARIRVRRAARPDRVKSW